MPLTVIGGYLGAGKTSLINRLLREPHGLRLMVLVNDFGSINIDADLLESSDEDTLTLTNGCVCCTMGADLFMALGDALDRRPRPDHLVVEASGVANPARIANAARAEPELAYGGAVTLVDALHFPALVDDERVGAQVREQVAVGDLVLVTKATGHAPDLAARLSACGAKRIAWLDAAPAVAPLLLGGLSPRDAPVAAGAHPAYASWSYEGAAALDRATLMDRLRAAPVSLYRIKGRVRAVEGGSWTVQGVGNVREVTPGPDVDRTTLVAIGPGLDTGVVERWWAG